MEVSGKLSSSSVLVHCEICQTEEKSTQATGFCNECEEYMCQICFQHHLKSKLSRNHVLGNIQMGEHASIQMKEKTTEEKCKFHVTENLRYYCSQHDKVGCGDCMLADHGTCKPEIIKDIAHSFDKSEVFKDVIRMLRQFESDNTENSNRCDQNFEKNKTLLEQAKREIRHFRNKINEYLSQAEEKIDGEIARHFESNQTTITQLQQKISIINQEIAEINSKLDTNVFRDCNLFIRMIECKALIKQVEDNVQLAEIKSNNNLISYRFHPQQKLEELIMTDPNLGSIVLNDVVGPKQASNEEINKEHTVEQEAICLKMDSTSIGDDVHNANETKVNEPECSKKESKPEQNGAKKKKRWRRKKTYRDDYAFSGYAECACAKCDFCKNSLSIWWEE